MANRVNDEQLKCIKTISPATLDTTPWITAANTGVNTINSTCGTSFDESTLGQIELFLAAHFVGTFLPEKVSERFENYATTFQVGSSALKGVTSDKYGQTANMLSNGCLAELDKSPATVDLL